MHISPGLAPINTQFEQLNEAHAAGAGATQHEGSPIFDDEDGERTPTAPQPALHSIAADYDSGPELSDGETTPTISSSPHPESDAIDSHRVSMNELQQQHPPTSYEDVKRAVENGENRNVVLWRGTNTTQAGGVGKHGTAGGVAGKDENTPAPSDEEARGQAAGASGHRGGGPVKKLPEYTTDQGVAQSYGRSNQVMAVEVNSKYLTAGSGSELGWAIHDSAPAKLLGVADGPDYEPGAEHDHLPDAG